MPSALRSPLFALATLAAFVLAQPAAWCAALCLVEGQPNGVHAMHGHDRGTSTIDGGTCHTGSVSTAEHASGQVLSPMVPATEPVIAVALTRWVEPGHLLPTSPHLISPTVEPPPPRLV